MRVARESGDLSAPDVYEGTAGHEIRVDTMRSREQEQLTKYREGRGHIRTVMDVPGTMTGRLARV